MEEIRRKCLKCGISSADDPSITLHRFPKPGKTNSLCCEIWAKYCFPQGPWSSLKFQEQLYAEHRMLCNKHFDKTAFMDVSGKRLFRLAQVQEHDKVRQIVDFKTDFTITARVKLEQLPTTDQLSFRGSSETTSEGRGYIAQCTTSEASDEMQPSTISTINTPEPSQQSVMENGDPLKPGKQAEEQPFDGNSSTSTNPDEEEPLCEYPTSPSEELTDPLLTGAVDPLNPDVQYPRDDEKPCRICLRTDRKLKVVDHKLSQCHTELCGVYESRYHKIIEDIKTENGRESDETEMYSPNLTLNKDSADNFEGKTHDDSNDSEDDESEDDKKQSNYNGMGTIEYLDELSISEDIIVESECVEDKSAVSIDDCDIKDEDELISLEKPFNDLTNKEEQTSVEKEISIKLDDKDVVNEDDEKQTSPPMKKSRIDSLNKDNNMIHQTPAKQSFLLELANGSFSYDNDDTGQEIETVTNTDNNESETPIGGMKRKVIRQYRNEYKKPANIDVITELANVTLAGIVKSKLLCQYNPKKISISKNNIIGKLIKMSLAANVPAVKWDLEKTLPENTGQVPASETDENPEMYKLRSPFSKERLQEELRKKFSLWHEIRAEDGTVIDKEFIMSCIEDKVTELVMKQLWHAIYGKQVCKANALRIFKSIQNKYRNDEKFQSVFDIEYMTTREKMLEEFQRRKTYECYLMSDYKCEMCYQAFKHEKLLDQHRQSHHESGRGLPCSICTMKFRSKDHESVYHSAVYKCKMCPLVTYYRGSMINHYHQHLGVQYKCEPCGLTYKTHSSYLTHFGKRHRNCRNVCTACGHSFRSELGLKTHQTKMHKGFTPSGGDDGVRCFECDLSFPSLEVYLTHVSSTHARRPFNAVNTRTRKEPNTKPGITKPGGHRGKHNFAMTCRVCNAVGGGFGWLTQHFRLEHPTADMSALYADKNKHLCHICAKAFSTEYKLRDHLSLHAGARPFACGACPKRFHARGPRLRHARLHAPPALACARCGKMFRSESNLYNHMRIHIGDRRFKCTFCGKGFLHSGSLNEHVRGVHYKVRRMKKKPVTDTAESGKL